MKKQLPTIIPVIDVMGGRVVRAVAGRRHEYLPLVSSLIKSTDPLHVAKAMLTATQANTLYVADLDRILGHTRTPADLASWAEELNVTIWADCGGCCTESERVRSILNTESTREPTDPTGRVVCLDLRAGQFVGEAACWQMTTTTDFDRFFRCVAAAAAIIILDVASVGLGGGLSTRPWCEMARQFTSAKIITGGGVRSWADLDNLPADGVLVSTAIHQGQLP